MCVFKVQEYQWLKKHNSVYISGCSNETINIALYSAADTYRYISERVVHMVMAVSICTYVYIKIYI